MSPNDAPSHHPGSPVFVDRSGRRRRVVTMVGAALAVILTAGIAALLAGFSSDGPLTGPNWPDASASAKPHQPSPDDSASAGGPSPTYGVPSSNTSPAPKASPTPGATAAPPPTTSPTKPSNGHGKPTKTPGKP